MVGLWEGVPASPCSGASDDATRNPPTRYSRRNRAKRSRVVSSVSEASSAVAPADPKAGLDGKANKLKDTAADERRKILLAKLRLIDQRKAALRNSTRDPMASVIEVATPEPYDGDAPLPSTTTKGGKGQGLPSPLTLDVSVAKISALGATDPEKFCGKGKGASSSAYGSPLPSPSTVQEGSPSLSYADLPTRRSSRRTTRPRTPNVLLNKMPGETVLQKLPVGVLKCKRYSFCKKVISILFKNPSSAPFSAPVKELWRPEAIPRYFDVISRPMDLGTIKKNMEGTHYLNMEVSDPLLMFRPNMFANDVRQVFRNAKIYNSTGDVLYNCANDLLKDFEHMFSSLPDIPSRDGNSRKRQGSSMRPASSHKRGRLGDQLASGRASSANGIAPKSPVSPSTAPGSPTFTLDDSMSTRQLKRRLDYLKKCRIALQARVELPKQSSLQDRGHLLAHVDMNESEKNEIIKGIKRLPTAKVCTVLEIVGQSEDVDEVEIDVHSLDNATLRVIEAFLETALPNFKTLRNSSIGREFRSPDEFEEEFKLIKERLETAKQPKSARKPAEIAEPVLPLPARAEPAAQLYESSDDDSGSDSDSDSSDSETD